jgi:hypothetical protein
MNFYNLIALVMSLMIVTGTALAEEQRTIIHSSAEQVQPLLPGMQAPAFELRDAAGQPVHFDPTAFRAFGIAFEVPPELVAKYRGYGIDLEAASGEAHHVLPAPSTFIIGADGTIHFAYTNLDYTVRLHPDVLLAAARAYVGGADHRLRKPGADGK